MKKSHIGGAAALFTATLIWGTSFVIMKDTLDSVEPLLLLAVRFTIGAVVLALVCVRRFKALDRGYLGYGALMGTLLGVAYITQTYGLNLTTPGKNAFLTAVYCVLVPFLYWMTDKKRPDGYNVAAAVLCFAGVGLLSVSPGGMGGVNWGDMLTLIGGVMYAVHIIVVKRAGGAKSDMLLLTCIQFATAAVICWAGTLIFEGTPTLPKGNALYSLAYLGLVATTLALFLQNFGQVRLAPSPASIILSFEALFGAALSMILGYDKPEPQLFIGFALMFAAVIISEAKPFRRLARVNQ